MDAAALRRPEPPVRRSAAVTRAAHRPAASSPAALLHRPPTAAARRGPWRNEDGASAVEFALLLPVLLLIVLGIVEYGLYLFGASVLQDALGEAARFGITGRTLPGITRTAAIRAVFERRLAPPLDPDEITFETLVYPDFDSIGRPEPFEDRNGNGVRDPGELFTDVNGNGRWDPDMGTPGAGGPDSVVLYRARHPWRPLTPLFRWVFGDGAVLVATVAVRNEPFPDGP